MATDVASRSRTISIGSNLGRQEASRFVVALETSLHEDHPAFLGQMAVLLERLGKHHHLEAARGIVQREDAHAIAFARLQRAQAPTTMPPIEMSSATRPFPFAGAVVAARRRVAGGLLAVVGDRHGRRVPSGRQLGGGPGAVVAQIACVAIDRMAAPIEPERLLLVLQLLDLGPGAASGSGRSSARDVPVVLAAEQLDLSQVLVPLVRGAVLAGAVDGREQPRANDVERLTRGRCLLPASQ